MMLVEPPIQKDKGVTISVTEQQVENSKSEFERLLEESLSHKFEQGDIVPGNVVRVERDGVLVDVGGKSEGFVPMKEVSNVTVDHINDVCKVGESYEFYILREENENGQLTLSLKRVAQARGWVQLENMKRNDDTIRAKISQVVKGGVVVDVYGLRGFVPASQLRVKGTTPEELIGMEIPMKILETDTKRNKLILSQRLAVQEEKAAQREKILSTLESGQVVTGEVVRIADFGAFIDLGGLDGLLPISEISWERVSHPSDVLKVGQMVTTKVLKVDQEKGHISLSLKQMQPDPWKEIEDKFNEGQVVNGTVRKIQSFGAFVQIYPGVDALLPTVEMSETPITKPEEVVQVGQQVKAIIKKFSPKEHKISLSLKGMDVSDLLNG
ncbi:MAG: 30S ribosomal protein S1 [Candidatus Obscuribacter sp.]|jgi:small subunit ribosomal protein S1|nr:30S ribosomal protein S1 [Candidatus Obscuribacter sp.]MDQ5966496.1 ribosomal protein [Cyanobacteriota bacterium erpe_2018_sw_39hr_WHONDRS-SW48-000098_B_bin.30]MBK7839246.1 30S ribosomal protein S1 [Candidatus Obscuribacter sp.]MBK9203149.1 30S ribosomal protein S1 [Candidatus Obscuribacter sp.]MBK9619264.1 30S ribosomal protein S1 [Candidatus Obscuribacter sp.]